MGSLVLVTSWHSDTTWFSTLGAISGECSSSTTFSGVHSPSLPFSTTFMHLTSLNSSFSSWNGVPESPCADCRHLARGSDGAWSIFLGGKDDSSLEDTSVSFSATDLSSVWSASLENILLCARSHGLLYSCSQGTTGTEIVMSPIITMANSSTDFEADLSLLSQILGNDGDVPSFFDGLHPLGRSISSQANLSASSLLTSRSLKEIAPASWPFSFPPFKLSWDRAVGFAGLSFSEFTESLFKPSSVFPWPFRFLRVHFRGLLLLVAPRDSSARTSSLLLFPSEGQLPFVSE